MAAADTFTITLTGRGGHAAMPHLARDPLPAGCGLVQALQTLIARETDPLDRAVLSVTTFHAGDAHNVVAETATIGGTVRTFAPKTRDRLEARIEATAAAIAAAHRLEAETRYRRGYPPTINHEAEARKSADAAATLLGEANVVRDPLPAMVAEDFAYFLEQRPGAYVWLGVGGAEDGKLLHSPHYDFNDAALTLGASYWVRLVERELGVNACACADARSFSFLFYSFAPGLDFSVEANLQRQVAKEKKARAAAHAQAFVIV